MTVPRRQRQTHPCDWRRQQSLPVVVLLAWGHHGWGP